MKEAGWRKVGWPRGKWEEVKKRGRDLVQKLHRRFKETDYCFFLSLSLKDKKKKKEFTKERPNSLLIRINLLGKQFIEVDFPGLKHNDSQDGGIK